jgi:hypothetical protein
MLTKFFETDGIEPNSKVLDAFCWDWQGIVNANKEFYSLFLDIVNG